MNNTNVDEEFKKAPGRLFCVFCIHDGPQCMEKRAEYLEILRTAGMPAHFVNHDIPALLFKIPPGGKNPLDRFKKDKETFIDEVNRSEGHQEAVAQRRLRSGTLDDVFVS
ncbi:hypothetical protein G6514_003845 [Epicoccum nigrum]|nr:hypothetical protein G6514_003845 [Epicoccum nigrum]